MVEKGKIQITLTKSPIGAQPRQRKVVKALGLRKMHQSVVLNDTPATRGAVAKVSHLVTVLEPEPEPKTSIRSSGPEPAPEGTIVIVVEQA